MNSEIIEILRRLQCSDAACGDLRIAMAAKLAIYEIEKLRAERDQARRMYCYAIPENCDEREARKIAWERGWDCYKEEDGK